MTGGGRHVAWGFRPARSSIPPTFPNRPARLSLRLVSPLGGQTWDGPRRSATIHLQGLEFGPAAKSYWPLRSIVEANAETKKTHKTRPPDAMSGGLPAVKATICSGRPSAAEFASVGGMSSPRSLAHAWLPWRVRE